MSASLSPIVQAPRRRWWYVFSAMLVPLIAGPVGWYYVTDFSVQRAWQEAEAETDAIDPRWRLADIEADREQIPDAENSALRIIGITRQTKNFAVGKAENYQVWFPKEPEPFLQLNEDQEKLIRNELAKIARPLAEARTLKDMPRGRFPITYADDFMSTLIAEQQNARAVGEWLQHDAWIFAQKKKYDKATESCQAIINVGRAFGDEPLLISWLIRVAMRAVAEAALERVLAQGQASDESLRQIQALLEREIANAHFLQGIRGERAGAREMLRSIRAGKVHLDEISMPPEKRNKHFSIGNWIADRGIQWYYPDHLRRMNRAIEIASLPIHEREAEFQTWHSDADTARNILTSLFMMSLVKLHRVECRSQAMLRATVAAIACERYRLKHKTDNNLNAWPASLDVLVKEKLLDAVPADPMDNQPMRYRRTEEGVVLYSIGLDRVDNQGAIDRDHPEAPGVDIGFRLWHVERRRQPALPGLIIPKED